MHGFIGSFILEINFSYILIYFIFEKNLVLAPCKQFDARPFAGGYIKRNGFKHNEKVTFGCNDPFVIDGQETLRCDDGTWSHKLPVCGGLFLCIFICHEFKMRIKV